MKHAYLILCHRQMEQVRCLLEALDDVRNDIFIHVDRKSGPFPEKDLRNAVKKSGLFFTERIRANWGGYSLVRAELILLREAVARGEYDRYHLISGADLPIKSQDEIHGFFDENPGREFVSFRPMRPQHLLRLSHYHPFSELRGRGFHSERDWQAKLAHLPFIVLARSFDKVQSVLSVNRLGQEGERFFFGSQWFSITHGFAAYLLTQTDFIQRHFRATHCPDEHFVQTILMNSSFREAAAGENLRLIDWKRGRPYIFTEEDYDTLMSSDCLFARKFDIERNPGIIRRIVCRVRGADASET